MSEAWARAATERARAARPAWANESLIANLPLLLGTQPQTGSSGKGDDGSVEKILWSLRFPQDDNGGLPALGPWGRASRPPASCRALFDAANHVGAVRLLEETVLLLGEGDVHRAGGILQVVQVRRPDDRRDDARPGEEPRERDPGGRDAPLASCLDDPPRDLEVLVDVELPGVGVALRPRRVARLSLSALPGEEAPAERAPRDDPDPVFAAERKHLALLLAIGEVVVVLHRDETGPAVLIRNVEHPRELPRVHARRADVARLAGAHDVVQSLHRLLDRRLRVVAVDLVEVHVIHPESPERRVDRRQDVLPGKAPVIGALPHRVEDLRRDDEVLALREVANR